LPVGASLQLPDDAARHVQVLRMQPGDKLSLFNGLGGSHTARVVHMGKHTVDIEVLSHEPQEREALCATHIAVGMQPTNAWIGWWKKPPNWVWHTSRPCAPNTRCCA